MVRQGLLAVALAMTTCAGVSRGDVEVKISGMHICCPACERAINGALEEIEGLRYEVDRREKMMALRAEDTEIAQSAVNALADAGFHGRIDSDDDDIHFEPVDVPEGAVERLELVGLHNCCRACQRAIDAAVNDVDGVQGTASPDDDTLVVEGRFSAAELVEALFEAGFHARIKDDD